MAQVVPRFRLIDGVIIAAVAMLSIKALGLFSSKPERAAELRIESTAPAAGFGRVLTHARTNYVPSDPTTTGSLDTKASSEPEPNQSAPARPAAAPPLLPGSSSERILLERLGERREELQQRAREMEAREKLIQEQERKLEERLGQMKAAEEGKKGAAAAAQGGASELPALKNLVVMYEAMKPKEAARVFDRLPLEVLISVVTQMNSRKMAEILAAMTPENAERLTVALAKRENGDRGRTAAALPPGELPAIELPAPARR
jgi:flagellar motility protein MotE (MotC chaperone)